MTRSPTHTYDTIPLPSPVSQATRPAILPSLASKYAKMRLEILLNSPGAFASNYGIESKFTPEEWQNRIWRKGVTVFVCVARPAGIEYMAYSELGQFDGEWVGAATVFGPIPRDRYQLAPESGSPETGADGEETKWQTTALFTSPEHRGQGLAKSLIDSAKVYARAQTLSDPKINRIRIRMMADPKNNGVARLYGSLGFIDVARATGREAFLTNGDEALIAAKMGGPEEGRKMMLERFGLVMEYTETLQ